MRALYVPLLWLCLIFAAIGFALITRGRVLFILEQTTAWRQGLDAIGLTEMDHAHQRRGRAYLKSGGGRLLSFVLLIAIIWFAGRLAIASGSMSALTKEIQWLLYTGCVVSTVDSLLIIGVGVMNLIAARLPPSPQH